MTLPTLLMSASKDDAIAAGKLTRLSQAHRISQCRSFELMLKFSLL
jgi:hypothetical protein